VTRDTRRLFNLLNEYAALGHRADYEAHYRLWPDRDAIDTAHAEQERIHAPRRREMAVEIDALVAAGTPWPWMGHGWGWFRVRADRGQGERPQTERPQTGYCVRWNGSWWEICGGVKERRDAGYVPLMMCWPGKLPQAGSYLTSGPRARFVYQIAEVEKFKPPRTAKRYTCRLWCQRVLHEDVPKEAHVHDFRWHPRKKAA
jgi:hypothetical protein